MELFADIRLSQIVSTLVYSVLGFALFLLSLWVMEKLTTFSIKKEIVDEHNVSMAIVVGSVMLAMAIILAAVID